MVSGRPGQSRVAPLFTTQITEEYSEIPALHLLRGRGGRHRQMEIGLGPPREPIGGVRQPSLPPLVDISWGILGHTHPLLGRLLRLESAHFTPQKVFFNG